MNETLSFLEASQRQQSNIELPVQNTCLLMTAHPQEPSAQPSLKELRRMRNTLPGIKEFVIS